MDQSSDTIGTLTFSTDSKGVDWQELKAALQADKFCNGRTADEYRRSAEGSFLNVFVYSGNKVVGNGRILSDGVCNAYIVDVWTASSHRRQGIGTRIVEILCASVPGQHIYLQTDDQTRFYQESGFKLQEYGMGLVMGSWLNRS